MSQIYISGDASPSDVAAPRKFSAGTNYQATGILTDYRGSPNGAGYVTALSAKSDSGGNIVLEPPTGIYSSGKNVNGYGALIANDANFKPANWLSTVTMFGTPGTIPVISSGADPAQGVGLWGDGALAVYPSVGYRKGGAGAGEIKVSVAQMQSVNPDLLPANILAGKSIFGVAGTAIQGKRVATGSSPAPTNSIGFDTWGGQFAYLPVITVTGLAFKPGIVIIYDAGGYPASMIWSGGPHQTADNYLYYLTAAGGAGQLPRATSPTSLVQGGFTVGTGTGGAVKWVAVEE